MIEVKFAVNTPLDTFLIDIENFISPSSHFIPSTVTPSTEWRFLTENLQETVLRSGYKSSATGLMIPT
jgi:hypothetical protein